MKWGIGVLFAVVLLLLAQPGLGLADNQNLVMATGSIRCLNAYIPDDWGEITGKVIFEITSDCEWCDLSRAIVTTDQDNPVVFPVCIQTPESEENRSISFTVGISALNRMESFSYGVCVADQEDLDSGMGNPCNVANTVQDIFAFSIDPSRLYAGLGEQVSYTLLLQSQADITLELTSIYGSSKTVDLTPGQPHQISFGLQAPAQTGQYDVSITARILNCNFDSCEKQATAELIVGNALAPSANFSIFLFPENYNIETLEAVAYTLRITNFEEPKSFNARLYLPEGIITDFIPRTLTVSSQAELQFNITPTSQKMYEIKAEVESSSARKQAVAYLTVGEMSQDLQRMADTQDLTAQTQSNIDTWVQNYGNTSYNNKMDSFGNLMNQIDNTSPGWQPQPAPEEPQGINIWFIIIPVAIAVVLLLFYFFRKRTVEEEDYGYEDGYRRP